MIQMSQITVKIRGSRVEVIRDGRQVTAKQFAWYREPELVRFIAGYIIQALDDLRHTERDVLRRTRGG